MKKTAKIAGLISVLSILTLTTAMAQSKPVRQGNGQGQNMEMSSKRGENQNENRFPGNPGPGKCGLNGKNCENENQILGIVKKVNTAACKITVTNLDGKEVEVQVTPFTHIMALKDRPEPCRLEEIHRDDWVMISTVKTDTKTLAAGRILVKNKPGNVPEDNSNAK